MSPRAIHSTALENVVSLAEALRVRRIESYRARLDRVLESNRSAVGRLFTSGTLFTRDGTRAGRELLQAHEHLLRVMTLLERLSDQGDVPSPKKPASVDAVFLELDTLLERTTTLTAQTTDLLGELKRE